MKHQKQNVSKYNETNLPICGTRVKLIPSISLVSGMIKVDNNHPYANRNLSGTILNRIEYAKENNYHHPNRMHLVPVKLDSGDIYILSPDFLVEIIPSSEKKKPSERRSYALLDKVKARIKELQNN